MVHRPFPLSDWRSRRSHCGDGRCRAPVALSCFCEMKYLLEKETHNKNEDNTLKEQNEIFLTVYGLRKIIFIRTLRKPK